MLAVQPVVFADDPQLAEIPDRPARAGGGRPLSSPIATQVAPAAQAACTPLRESSNTRQRDGATPSLAAARR